MQKFAIAALALGIFGAAATPALSSGTTSPENTCKRGMVYDTKAGKCVKIPK